MSYDGTVHLHLFEVCVAGGMGMHLSSISSERLQHCNPLSTTLTGTTMSYAVPSPVLLIEPEAVGVPR